MHKLKNHSIEKSFLYRPVERCRYRCLSWACSRLFVEEMAEIRVCFVQSNTEVSELQQQSQPAFHSTYGHRTWTSMRAIPARERASHFWCHFPAPKTCSATMHLAYRRSHSSHCTLHSYCNYALIANYARIAAPYCKYARIANHARIAAVLQITPVLLIVNQIICVDDPTPAPWAGPKWNVPAAPAALRRRTLLRVRGAESPLLLLTVVRG